MTHTVKLGESMASIAAKHGLTVGALWRANPQVVDPSLIFPGQIMNIPAPRQEAPVAFSEQYRVRSGDTMSKIARTFGVALSALIAANPQIPDPDVLRVGQIVMVPATAPAAVVQPVTTPSGSRAPIWYRIAQREFEDGIVEITGSQHNPRILEYHSSVTGGFDANEIPWCSSFVNWCMEQAEITGTDSATARSWERWGKKLAEPVAGAVAVFWRGTKSSGKGHVGFFVKQTTNEVSVLGGNQGNRISIDNYPKARLLSYRWPKGL